MTKQDIVDAGKEIQKILDSGRTPRDKDADRLAELGKKYDHIPAIKQLFKDDYDRKAVHSGFGAPDCSCFINPPCQNCVDWTNFCKEREIAVSDNHEPGCLIIEHDCEIGRGEIRAE